MGVSAARRLRVAARSAGERVNHKRIAGDADPAAAKALDVHLFRLFGDLVTPARSWAVKARTHGGACSKGATSTSGMTGTGLKK
jgi:hypothetical protein